MRLVPSTFGPLAPYLIDLAAAFEARGLPLMLVGGFGLVLRRQWRQEQGERTLIDAVPPARATEDFDVLLTLELLENPKQRQAIREALTQLGYQVTLQNLHFVKPGSGGNGRRDVKVDFLAPIPDSASETLEVTNIRVKPKATTPADSLHGFPTSEAALLSADLLAVLLEGQGTDGQERQIKIFLPHPFMLIVMKLCAFRDELQGKRGENSSRPEYARKHLADVYTLIALLTQSEAAGLAALATQNKAHPVVRDAQNIVQTLLSSDQTRGTLLLRETLTIDPADLEAFLDMLGDTFK